ncbi:MAG: TonB-dependent receptor, partial [Rikenellaceae bacterium]
NFQPGLRVDYNCSNCGVPQLRINGLEGQYSQILLDSRPIFSSLSSVYGLEQMPAGMIERMEVIRGGGSALYGSNAIGGVVNIITKEPVSNTLALSNTTSVMKGGATDINTTLNGSFVSPDNKFGLYMFSMVRDRKAYDRDDDGFSEIPELKSKTIGFRGYYKTSQNSKITLEYHNLGEYRRGGDLLNLPAHEANIAEQLDHDINGGGAKYDIFSSDLKHRFNVYASAQKINRKSYFGTHQNPDAYGKSDDLTALGGAQYTYNMKRLFFMPSEFTVGGEYSYNELNDKMLGYDRNISQRSIIYGGYLQNEWKNEKFSFLIGARIDKHNKVKDVIVSPRANVRYTPHKNVILRASYSSGYRAPQAYDEDLHVAAVGGEVSLIVLHPDLKPEYSNSISASADLYRTFGNFTANVLIEGFYTKLNDVFTLVENGKDSGGNMLLERRNAKGMKITGVNVEARVNYKSFFNIQGGFTHQKSRYDEPIRWSSEVAPQSKLLRSPDNYGYLSANWNVTKKFSLSSSATYTGSMIASHFAGYIERDREVKTDSFWDMGAKVAYTFRLTNYLKFELSGGVKNLFDSYQKDIDKGVDRDSKFIYGPNAPRTFYIGAKFTL